MIGKTNDFTYCKAEFCWNWPHICQNLVPLHLVHKHDLLVALNSIQSSHLTRLQIHKTYQSMAKNFHLIFSKFAMLICHPFLQWSQNLYEVTIYSHTSKVDLKMSFLCLQISQKKPTQLFKGFLT